MFVLLVQVAFGLTPPIDPYGMVGTAEERINPGEPRVYSTVSPRVISNAVCDEKTVVNDPRGFNFMGIIFGQLIDHDVVLSGDGGEGAGDSWPIEVPEDDPVYSSVGLEELSFTRVGRNAINRITPHVDGSLVYGSSKERLELLRQTGTAFLRTDQYRLPPVVGETELFVDGENKANMYFCGDGRCSEQVFLTSLHSVWLREHNHQARRLSEISDDSEVVFEKARQIVIAEIQHVTYGEWLSALIGESRNCNAWAQGEFADDGDKQISVAFAAALYRLHSLIANQTAEALEQYGVKGLASAFFTPEALRIAKGNLAPFVRSMYTTLARKNDPLMVPDLRNFLFAGQPGRGPLGHDLAALNIQRGRDQGVPTYGPLRRALGLSDKLTFDEVTDDPKLAEALASVYESPEECDAWVCASAEPLAPGSSLGETQTFVVREEFCTLHNTDLYFWERAHHLSEEDKAYVRGRRFSDILCDNTGVCDVSRDNAFLGTSSKSSSSTGTAALVGGLVAIGVVLLCAFGGLAIV